MSYTNDSTLLGSSLFYSSKLFCGVNFMEFTVTEATVEILICKKFAS